jgi:hypothetical protein
LRRRSSLKFAPQMPGTLDTARLAVLADSLLDAGCDNDDLIQHCRQSGEHVRGCWVVDLVLSKDRTSRSQRS